MRPKAEQEADKKRIIEANSQTESGKRWVRDKFLPEYKTDEQKRDDDIARSNADYDKRMEFVNNYLKGSAKESGTRCNPGCLLGYGRLCKRRLPQ